MDPDVECEPWEDLD